MMGIKKCMKDRAVGLLSISMTAVLIGCQGSVLTAGEIGQVEVMDEAAILSPERELTLQAGESATAVGGQQSGRQEDSGKEMQEAEQSLSDEESADVTESEESQPEESQPEKPQPPKGWELILASEDWGLSFGESGTQPKGNAAAEDLAWYDAYYVGGDGEKVIYLTFDCGYENGNTEPILDALKKHDVQATFFVVGHFLETAPDMVRRMVEEGHAVGSHTYHHPDMPTISDPEIFRKEMDDVADLFYKITGTELSLYYRPPQGKCNIDNLRMAQELGYSTVFWSLAYVDWNQDDQPSHEEALEKLTSRIHPGAVVLLHNTSQTNGEILDKLLTEWESMGYSFEPLSKLTMK